MLSTTESSPPYQPNLKQSCKMSQIWRMYPYKKLEGWGKKSGGPFSFAKSSIVLGKFEQLN